MTMNSIAKPLLVFKTPCQAVFPAFGQKARPARPIGQKVKGHTEQASFVNTAKTRKQAAIQMRIMIIPPTCQPPGKGMMKSRKKITTSSHKPNFMDLPSCFLNILVTIMPMFEEQACP